MKTIKFTSYWTAEEADCICQLLDDFKSALWQVYGEEIIAMHQEIRDEQRELNNNEFDDEIPF